MQCVVITGFGEALENLSIVERADPVPGPGEVRVAVRGTALNRADLLQRRGLYPAPPGSPEFARDIPGLEFVGRIDALGEGVTRWRSGERVFGIVSSGGYSTRVVTNQDLVVEVPERLSDAEAAAVPEAFFTAFDALVLQCGMKSGQRVLLHAVASGVGSAAVQIVHAWGAEAIGTAGSDEKLAKVASIAPIFPINYRTRDFRDAIEERYGKDAVDIVLDVVGASYWRSNLEVLRSGGRLVLVGRLGGSQAQTPLAVLMTKRLKIIGTVMRSRPFEEKRAVTRAFEENIVPLLANGTLRPVVDSQYSLAEIRRATERMERNENTGKIVMIM
jgi:putative PIG3 family NAD(P)H quinone oxidoreductase